MELTRQPISRTELGIGRPPTSIRATGVHASDLFNDIYKELQPQRYSRQDLSKDDLEAYAEVGFVWETVLSEGMARRLVERHNEADRHSETVLRPPEGTYCGVFEGYQIVIHYNPDLHIYNDCFRIGEIKGTWKSSHISNEINNAAWAGDPQAWSIIEEELHDEKWSKYFDQLRLYRYFERTPYARLYIFCVVGDYKVKTPQILPPIDITFSQDELDETAAMCFYNGIQRGLFSKIE